MLKIVEVFPSVQGEGLRQGSPTIFIRLAGCNLRCAFCDTKQAWEGGRPRTEASVADTVARLRQAYPTEWVCLTGGEPLFQDIGPLVHRLKDDGLKIQIETNGLLHRPLPIDWVTVSPKPPAYAFRPEYRSWAREVKLVVSGHLSFAVVSGIRAAFPDRTPVLLQLESNSTASLGRALRLLKRALKDGLPNVRLAVQLHKLLNLP